MSLKVKENLAKMSWHLCVKVKPIALCAGLEKVSISDTKLGQCRA